MKRPFRVLFVVALSLGLGLAGCTPKTAFRGNAPLPSQLNLVEVGQSTQTDIQRLIGSPSTIGTFDPHIWYYMSQRTEQWAFLDPEVVEHQILVLVFDKNSVLQHIKKYNKEDLQAIAISGEETHTAGHSPGVFQQILGNFGRIKQDTPAPQ